MTNLKDDGTYVVEFRTADWRRAGDIEPANRPCDPIFPGADALRLVRPYQADA
jgi:hypothetical protein